MKQKVYLLPENLKLSSIKKSKYLFGAFCVVILGSYLSPLILCLNHDFNHCNSFALSSVDKFTIRILSFVSVMANAVAWLAAELRITKFVEQVRMKLIS